MSDQQKHYYLAAGGTGGHLFPALALGRALSSCGNKVTLLTDARGQQLMPSDENIQTVVLPILGKRHTVKQKCNFVLSLLTSTKKALKTLGANRPDLVIGFGGYPALPTMLAVLMKGYPLLLHEQNAYLGKVNRLAARCALKIATSYVETHGIPPKDGNKTIHTGMPVRDDIAALAETPYSPPTEEIRLLVLGGSQGATILSHMIPQALALLPDALKKRLIVTQQSRPETLKATRDTYANLGIHARVETFFHDMAQELHKNHFVISRAGSSTVAELMAAHKPALLIPYPHAADDHQTYNAKAFAAVEGGLCCSQSTLTPQHIAATLQSYFEEPNRLTEAAQKLQEAAIPDATHKLAHVATELSTHASSQETL